MRYVVMLAGVMAVDAAQAAYEFRSYSSRSYYGSSYSGRASYEKPERLPKAVPPKPNLCDQRGAAGFEVVNGADRGCFGTSR